MDATNNDIEIDVEVLPFVRIYKSGRVERLSGNDVVPAGVDPATGVVSKDVQIDPATGVSARLYLPPLNKPKLPILVYYHGGAFIIETAFSPLYHNYLNALAAKAGILIVSVEYRRAPEHSIPTAHHDSWAALRWAASQQDPWLAEHGDPKKLYLSGDSAGGNLSHYVAVRAGEEGIEIEGVALVQPFFTGSERLVGEAEIPGKEVWGFVCPGTAGLDDPLVNPVAAGPPVAAMAGRRILVCVAEKDIVRARGVAYWEWLKGAKGDAELFETEGEEHVFHLFKPTCDRADELMNRLVSFFNHV